MARWLLLVALLGCERSEVDPDGGGGGDGGRTATQPSPLELYSDSFPSIVLEVDYQSGAEPFTGEVAAFGDTWSIFSTNAARLFLDDQKTLEIPASLGEMEELSAIFGEDFTAEMILAIAGEHRDTASVAPVASFYALWLDGYWNDGGERKTSVLGVSLGGTGVIAMFKPAIRSAGVLMNADRFAEQAILVHEFGHAVGVVENGVPAQSPHHDADHPGHCLNDRCVMFWAYEGASDLAMFVRDVVVSSDVILFAPDCLADVDAMP
jgi:hypothetical protein